MVYIFIDESGNLGKIGNGMSSTDFSMVAIVCPSQNIDLFIDRVKLLITKIKKKELKFSKLSTKEIITTYNFLEKLNLNYTSVYYKKTSIHYGEVLLKEAFNNLISKIEIPKNEKIKVFIDGTENAYFRKIYEPIIRKKFTRVTMKFANSMKTPIIQVADFYAGYRRRFIKQFNAPNM